MWAINEKSIKISKSCIASVQIKCRQKLKAVKYFCAIVPDNAGNLASNQMEVKEGYF